MRNFSFVLWMLLFPLVGAVDQYLTFLQRGNRPVDAVEMFVAAFGFTMWIVIGIILYERKPNV